MNFILIAREAEREAAGGGEIFYMRTSEDTSGKDGEIALFEYIEEHPPLVGLVGMCSKIKNYHKRKPGNDTGAKKHRYGETTLAHTSPFLGQMMPGQTIQTFENNLYRAPIYEHKVPQTDFIIIRTRNEYSVRENDGIFTVGQECPLYEVPGPNSKKANNFTRDFLQVFIYRLFWKSLDNPRRIKMDEIKKAFPAHSESSIRKRLKPCAEFHRTGHDSNWWVIKNNFRLPTEDEIRSMVNPEQCCSFFSMIAAEQRLRDAGYGEKSLIAQQDDDDEESAAKLDDEVKVAPWNTTRAYILAMKGKCLLQLTGPADPTGAAGEGFSYCRIPNKPTNKEEQEQQPKRTVTGTDADLRKLPLKDARNILRKNGVPEKEIMRLSRWEVIDVVRTLSTEKVKSGDDGDHKFSRGNRFSIAEHQERYREECQRIFDVQNKVLSSNEVLSSDEAESSEDEDNNDEDLDEMGKSIENMLANKKSSSQILREREEMERKNLMKIMSEGQSKSQNTPTKGKKDDDENSNLDNTIDKVLKITRTYKHSDGKLYTRTEIVRKPVVIDTYVKIRNTKDEAFIKTFATLDEAAKEEMKKEKRRIQEQLRRIRRNEEKERLGLTGPIKSQKDLINAKKKLKQKPDLKLKCGACGETGHMKTNKACPKYVEEFSENSSQPLTVAMTERDEEEKERRLQEMDENEQLVNVDGTKVRVSTKVVKHVEELRRETMTLKIPKKQLKEAQKEARKESKRRRAGTVEHCDYLKNKRYQTIKRRRTDPLISFASYLETIHNQLRVMDEALQFLQPVNPKKVPDYLDKIQRPMDLQTIRENIQQKKYHSREEFLADINQIVENSSIYNGPNDIYTSSAQKLLEVVISKFTEKEETLMRLEKAINPLLDDNDQVALTYILESILNDKIKSMQESWPFVRPVNKKQMKHYYDMIKEPMDLETIGKRVSKHMYHTRDDFLNDVDLIHKNSIQFNGPESEYTHKAQKILDVTKEALISYSDYLTQLEEKIREVQQRAIDQADVDSLGASLGELEDQRSASRSSDHGGSSGALGSESSSGMPKRGRGRPRKHPVNSDHSDVTGERDMDESGGNLMQDLQFSDSDMSDGEMDDEGEDWEDVDVTGDAGGISVTVGATEASDEMRLYQQQLSDQNMQGSNVYSTNLESNIIEEVVDEDYDPTDFLQNIGRGNENQSLVANNHPDNNLPHMQGAFVAGTVEMPSNIGNGEGPMVINALPPPEEGGPQALSNYTILDSHHHQASSAQGSGTIEDDLDISDDSDDGDSHQKQQANPVVPPHPFAGNQQQHQMPPGAMSVRVQEDDEIWF